MGFLNGTLIWSLAEFLLQLVGIRELHEKYLFGINITSWFWLTILLQGMSEGAFVAVLILFVGDRVLNKEKRTEGKKGLLQFFNLYYTKYWDPEILKKKMIIFLIGV